MDGIEKRSLVVDSAEDCGIVGFRLPDPTEAYVFQRRSALETVIVMAVTTAEAMMRQLISQVNVSSSLFSLGFR